MDYTPENLPKTNEEWRFIINAGKWIIGILFTGFIGGKIIWVVSQWFGGIVNLKKENQELKTNLIEVKKSIEDLKTFLNEKFISVEDFKEAKEHCRTERTLDLKYFLDEFAGTIAALDAKVAILLKDRGLLDESNDFKGTRKRKTDLSHRFPIYKKQDD